jgi:hypothetical protein
VTTNEIYFPFNEGLCVLQAILDTQLLMLDVIYIRTTHKLSNKVVKLLKIISNLFAIKIVNVSENVKYEEFTNQWYNEIFRIGEKSGLVWFCASSTGLNFSRKFNFHLVKIFYVLTEKELVLPSGVFRYACFAGNLTGAWLVINDGPDIQTREYYYSLLLHVYRTRYVCRTDFSGIRAKELMFCDCYDCSLFVKSVLGIVSFLAKRNVMFRYDLFLKETFLILSKPVE